MLQEQCLLATRPGRMPLLGIKEAALDVTAIPRHRPGSPGSGAARTGAERGGGGFRRPWPGCERLRLARAVPGSPLSSSRALPVPPTWSRRGDAPPAWPSAWCCSALRCELPRQRRPARGPAPLWVSAPGGQRPKPAAGGLRMRGGPVPADGYPSGSSAAACRSRAGPHLLPCPKSGVVLCLSSWLYQI